MQGKDLSEQSQVTSVYDGSMITFRMLRALGWGPQLLNLGYYFFSGPLTFLNFVPGRLRLSIRQLDLVAKAAKLLGPKPGDKIVDVACGRGHSSFYLSHLVPGLDITGIDLLPENVAVAQTVYKNTQGLNYQVGDAQSLPFPDASVDKVICLEAAFHFRDKPGFLREAWRVLRPGGRLVVVDFMWKDATFRKSVDQTQKAMVCNIWGFEDFFTQDEYLDAAKAVGLRLELSRDWTSKVTRPLLRQFRWLCAMGQTGIGRSILAVTNDQLRTFTKADWASLSVAEVAHRSVHNDSKYIALSWVK